MGACDDTARSRATVFRDSAGIRIAESRVPLWGPGEAWRLDSLAALSIGQVEGEEAYLLSRIAGLGRLSDGSIVVANGASDEIRVFDAAGHYRFTIGRRGEGPGEFTWLRALWVLPGDSILVASSGGGRFTLFAATGTLAATRFGPPYIDPLGRFRDGAFLMARYANPGGATEPGFHRDTLLYAAYRAETMDDPESMREAAGSFGLQAVVNWPVDTIAIVQGGERYRAVRGQGMTQEAVPFTPDVRTAVAGFEVFIGDGSTFRIDVRAHDGTLRRSIRLLEPNPPLAEADIEAWKTMRRGWARNDDQRAWAERIIAEMPFPDVKPAFSGLIVDSGGNLWVERYTLDRDNPSHWAVFDAEGRYLGDVETPAHFIVRVIGDDWMLGVQWNEEDVEFVRVYHLDRAG
jgi:hypothetical protein